VVKRALAAGLVLLTACATTSQSSATADYDAQQIASDAVRVFIDSWNRSAAGNAEGHQAYGTLYWPEAELVDPSGNIWRGQPAVVQMHVDLWNNPFKGSVVNGTVRSTRRLSATHMIADFDLELKVTGPLPPTIPSSNGVVKTHLKHVMERRNGEWKAIAAQNTFYSDAQPAR
jgi:uncharacterized protein (TIGR02246 family)